ncbi:hypothetical protein M8C21_012462 [Ambrosia artemisiifolia]|uniref:non-specific serine/threonine protein kinase n=1 Tax=Ambrosia artemisiifolia TaxID=4212 RepID=A0AAD5D3M3_AMBAR|nr:hypothetical protein M8C21_012462 [Ambrosia artemisiifolia]
MSSSSTSTSSQSTNPSILKKPIPPQQTNSKPFWVLKQKTPVLQQLYTIGRKLGQGQFGTTHLCTEKATGVAYACKSIPKKKLICREDYEDVLKEIQIMHHLSEHPNVVRIKGTYEDALYVHIVMELCAGGELFDRIVQKGQYSEREAAKLIKTIVGVVIAERLSEEEIGGLKELFKMIDTDNSGTITFDELKEGLRRVGSELMESEIKDLMDAADIDNSGTIDYGEFIAATVHLNKLEREENLLSAFSFFDKDGSGYITIDELQQACQEMGLGDVRLDETIKEIDQDNDGQIDYGEFAAMMRKGNGGIGRRTMRSNLNLGEALGVIPPPEKQNL